MAAAPCTHPDLLGPGDETAKHNTIAIGLYSLGEKNIFVTPLVLVFSVMYMRHKAPVLSVLIGENDL